MARARSCERLKVQRLDGAKQDGIIKVLSALQDRNCPGKFNDDDIIEFDTREMLDRLVLFLPDDSSVKSKR